MTRARAGCRGRSRRRCAPCGSMPAASKAASKARRWESVSTVEPDLLDTTTTVRSRSTRAARTCPGSEESRTIRSTPAVAQMTSGASEDPPIPHRTTWSTPSERKCSRSAATSPTSGRDERGRPTQDSRTAASDSASGPHSVASCSNSLLANRSSARAGTCGDGVRGGTRGDDPQGAHAVTLSSSARTPCRQLLPGGHELLARPRARAARSRRRRRCPGARGRRAASPASS